MSARLVRNSERQDFKQCRQRWWWAYVERRQAIDAPKALRFGDLIHQALAAYYQPGVKRGPHPARVYEDLYHAQVQEKEGKGFTVRSDDDWLDALDLGISMLEAYVETYADRDQQYKVIASEQTFRWPTKLPGKPPVRIVVVGTMDGIWQDRSSKELFFPEHKTATQVRLDGLALNEQPSVYWTYGVAWARKQGILKLGQEPTHVLFNFLRKARRNPDYEWDAMGRRLNKDGSVSKQQPAPFFVRQPVYRDAAERRLQHDRIRAEAREMMMAEEGKLAVYKNPGPLHNPNCAGCPFKDPCELHEVDSDWEEMMRATTTRWDPYDAHELVERR